MSSTLRAEHLFHIGFAAIFLRQPLQYLLGQGVLAVLLLGMVLCIVALLKNWKAMMLSRRERILATVLSMIFILHTLLALGSVDAALFRPLWFYSLAQLLPALLFLHYRESSSTRSAFQRVLALALGIECMLAFLQVSYYSTGIGLPPVYEEYEVFSFVSGSFFNANDFSVFVASGAIALSVSLMADGKDNRAYAVIGLANVAVFVSLSRTAFVTLGIFSFFTVLRGARKLVAAPTSRTNLGTLIVLVGVCALVAFALSNEFATKTAVFDRSLERIGQVAQTASDESASSRSTVYLRLLESLPRLGFGTFTDLDYARFFKYFDDDLMKINPHSFIAEMSFLYGWAGMACAGCLLMVLIVGIARNLHVPLYVRGVAIASLVFFQSVPSSILGSTTFFIPYLLLMYCRPVSLLFETPSRGRVLIYS